MIIDNNIGYTYTGGISKNFKIPDRLLTCYDRFQFAAYTDRDDFDGPSLLTQLPSLATTKIELWFTSTCNLSCPYCFVQAIYPTFNMKEKKVYYSRDRLRSYLEKYKPTDILSLGGEPTLYPDIILDAAELLEELNAPKYVKLCISTNSTLVDNILKVAEKTERVKFIVTIEPTKENYRRDFREVERIRFLKKTLGTKIHLKGLLIPDGTYLDVINSSMFDFYCFVRLPKHIDFLHWTYKDIITIYEMYPRIVQILTSNFKSYLSFGGDSEVCGGMLSESGSTNLTFVMGNNIIHKNMTLPQFSQMREWGYRQVEQRKLYFSDYSYGEFQGKHAFDYDTHLDDLYQTLIGLELRRTGILSHILRINAYFSSLSRKIKNCNLPSQNVDVILEIEYPTRVMNFSKLQSLISILGFKVGRVDNQLLREMEDYWLDSEGETLVIVSSNTFQKYSDATILAVKFEFEFVHFWLMGLKKNIDQVVSREKKGYPELVNKAFLVFLP